MTPPKLTALLDRYRASRLNGSITLEIKDGGVARIEQRIASRPEEAPLPEASAESK